MAQIFTSLLHCDLANIAQEMQYLEEIGIDGIHIEIMDGIFVPHFGGSLNMIKTLRRHTKLPLHCHMMITNPHKYAVDFIGAGADLAIFHIESTDHADLLAQEIKSYGKKSGVALNPATHESSIEYLYDNLDQVLIMTASPCSSPKFQPITINKIANISKKLLSYKYIKLGVYGDLRLENITDIVQAGAEHLVVGASLFKGTQNLQDQEKCKVMQSNLTKIRAKTNKIFPIAI